jgi:hypothetical protein
VLNYIKSLVW